MGLGSEELGSVSNIPDPLTLSQIVLSGSTPVSLSGTVYKTLDFPCNSLMLSGAGRDPAKLKFLDNGAGSGGAYLYQFQDGVTDELQFCFKMPRDWKLGTQLIPYIIWAPDTVSALNAVFRIESAEQKVGGIFTNTVLGAEELFAGNGTIHKTQINLFTPISMTNLLLDSVILGRVLRAGTSANDTYVGNCWMFNFGFIYQVDTIGSSGTLTK